MKGQENLDELLKKKLDDESLFEYREEDWNKVEKLIISQNKSKGLWYYYKRIIGVLSILIALFFLVFKIETDFKSTNKPKIAVKSEKTEAFSQENNTTFQGKNSIANFKENHSIEKSSNNILQPSKNKQLQEEINSTKTSNLSETKGSFKQIRNAKHSQPEISNLNIEVETKPESHLEDRLNEKSEYAEKQNHKKLFDLSKINIFNKNKVSNYYSRNYRNLVVFKNVSTESFDNSDDYKTTEKSDNDVKLKNKKIFAFNVIAGIGFYKQFAGNYSHPNAPSIDPHGGIGFDLFYNKEITYSAQLIYSQRRGINSSYYKTDQNGDSDFVSVNKLYTLELPLFINYTLSSRNACLAGVGLIYYVGNQSSVKHFSGAIDINSGTGIVKTDAYVLLGYKYGLSKKISVTGNAQIGIRDVTKNTIFKPKSREDNVSFRVSFIYTLFDKGK